MLCLPHRTSGPLVYVAEIDKPELSDADRHHLGVVLRLRTGDPVVVSDGCGSWRCGGFGSESGWGEMERNPAPRRVRIASAIPKGERLDWMVQKVTEVGATDIVLLTTQRSVVRWKSGSVVRHLSRLERVIRSAAAQSRRVWLPSISVGELSEFSPDPRSVIADLGAPADLDDEVDTILVGPEGGWTEEELPQGARRVGLGETVLRVETAAVLATYQLTSRVNASKNHAG